MEYKVGDKVILENAQELRDAGFSPEDAIRWRNKFGTIAAVIDDGRLYKILVDNEKFAPDEFVFASAPCIGMKVNAENKETYTLDELQHKAEEFKEYLEKVNNANDCCIDVLFETANGRDRKVGTEFKIRKI